MDKVLRLCFLVIFSLPSFAQIVVVKYNASVFDTKDKYGTFGFDDAVLVSSKTESTYSEQKRDTLFSIDNNSYQQEKDSLEVKCYKRLPEKNCLQLFAFSKRFIIFDDQYVISWTITEGHKKILGYDVQEATGTFRGRNYKAYFCPQIPFQNGPFKFDGLPGLILQVISDDGAVNITATEVRFSKDEKIVNVFAGEKTISWEEFKKEYKKVFQRFDGYSTGEGAGMSISNRGIEYYLN